MMGRPSRKNNSEKPARQLSEKWKKRLYSTLVLFFVLGVCYVTLSLLPGVQIGTLQVEGTKQMTREEVLLAAGLDQTYNIFAVDRGRVRSRLEQDARIELLSERYKWPLFYTIVVRERSASAYVPSVDGFVVLDRSGKVIQIQRRFSHMGAPLITGTMLPSLLIGETVQDETIHKGLEFLVQLSEYGINDFSELNLANPENIHGFTFQGVVIHLGSLKGLEEKADPASQVLKEIARSGNRVRYIDLKSRVPVVKFE